MKHQQSNIVIIYSLTFISWIALLLTYLFLPYWSGNSAWSILLSGCFILIVALTDYTLGKYFLRNRTPVKLRAQFRLDSPIKISFIFSLISIIGICFHMYDKFVLRGYVFDNCTGIRDIWLSDGADRGHKISSIYSALGHIFVYFGIIPIWILLMQSTEKSKRLYFSAFIGLACLIAYSYSLSSRSTIIYLIILSTVFSVMHNRKDIKKYLFSSAKVILLCTILFLIYSSYVFKQKIDCSNRITKNKHNYVESNFASHNLNKTWSEGSTDIDVDSSPQELNQKFQSQNTTIATDESPLQIKPLIAKSHSKYDILKYFADLLIDLKLYVNSISNVYFEKLDQKYKMVFLYFINPSANFDLLVLQDYDEINFNPLFDIPKNYLNKLGFKFETSPKNEKLVGLLSFQGFIYSLVNSKLLFFLMCFGFGVFLFLVRYLATRYLFFESLVSLSYSLILFSLLGSAIKVMAFPFAVAVSVIFYFTAFKNEKN
jgi:hypothetical protein